MPGGAVEILSAMLSVEDIAKAPQEKLNLTGGPQKRHGEAPFQWVPRLFARDAVRKNTTRTYQDQEEEELKSQLAGTVGEDMLEPGQEQLEESRNERSKRRKPNVEDVGPRRRLRLAKKKVTMGLLGTAYDPEGLHYYMAAVESGYAGTRQKNPRVFSRGVGATGADAAGGGCHGQGGSPGAGHREHGGAVGQPAWGLHGTASALHTDCRGGLFTGAT